MTPWSIFLIFLRLGLTSFGGPVAHLAYFRDEFVTRRRWFTDQSYTDLVGLCQFLPGPASSQVGISIGLSRGGYLGALFAWAGFTLPSAIFLILFAFGISESEGLIAPGILHGLKVVAVAIVAQAVWGMASSLCRGVYRIMLMAASALLALMIPTAWIQILIILLGGIVGFGLFKTNRPLPHEPIPFQISRGAGAVGLALFFLLLIGLPLSLKFFPNHSLAVFEAFYRAGALVFGGGHVVLPLLQAATVSPGWVDNDLFLAGYGAAQAVPGPLFTFSAFLGASMQGWPIGWLGGFFCLLAIFAPSFLLIIGVLPLWEELRKRPGFQAATSGINAAVVGLLLAALYKPVWVSAIFDLKDFALAAIAFVALTVWKLPAWLVVVSAAALGWAMDFIQ